MTKFSRKALDIIKYCDTSKWTNFKQLLLDTLSHIIQRQICNY